MQLCEMCKEMSFDQCSSVIQFETGLTAGTYEAWIRDKFNDYHTQTVTVNTNGDCSLNLSALDIAVTKYTGKMEVSLREIGVYNIDLEMNIGGSNYPCIMLSFYDKN